mmetsp:Transcript_7070/g.31118  ORF Transcript_7070/g.31118 Transcript_7070/m.31118 type:complete len:335 (-) Transcript_7070:1470-2474(-)
MGEGALPTQGRDVLGPQVKGENHSSLAEPGDRVESLASHRRSFARHRFPPAESGSENFAAKARDEFLSLANFPLPLGQLQVRRGALFGVLHPPIEHRRLHAAREPHERARERDAHPTTIGCLVHPLGEAPEHGPLRHSRESRGQPAPVHASGLPLLDPSSQRALQAAVRDRQRATLDLTGHRVPVPLLVNLAAPVRKRFFEQSLGHSHRRASKDGAPALVAFDDVQPPAERGERHATGHAHERGFEPASLHLVRPGVVLPSDKGEEDVPLRPGQRDAAGELEVDLEALVRPHLRLLCVLDDAKPVVKRSLLGPAHEPGEDVADHLALPLQIGRD